ncbi:hypothetical protein U14_02432 [Candidatus Moduliflexus flocculans]|uniref:Uncharacterized protein n=1 Tax=Candidatus Moduliflexus flocculans TaxID=1499966 RepID=A0A081BLC4_9BACT|nr:hypothetical protein U14_02432 [Candidatus Moduliflexus flocculans]
MFSIKVVIARSDNDEAISSNIRVVSSLAFARNDTFLLLVPRGAWNEGLTALSVRRRRGLIRPDFRKRQFIPPRRNRADLLRFFAGNRLRDFRGVNVTIFNK